MKPNLYGILKGRAYELAQITTGHTNEDARAKGFADVYHLIMSDSDHERQAKFLMLLPETFSEGHRKVLLDGMAQEYADLENWMAYVDRECS